MKHGETGTTLLLGAWPCRAANHWSPPFDRQNEGMKRDETRTLWDMGG